MTLAAVAALATLTTTAVAAQAVQPGNEFTALTISVVTAVFLSGGGFFVTKYKADAAHTRLTAHEVKQDLEDSKAKLAIEAMNRHMAEQHTAVITMIGQMELRLVDRINEASDTTPGFNRRRQPRGGSDVGANTDTED